MSPYREETPVVIHENRCPDCTKTRGYRRRVFVAFVEMYAAAMLLMLPVAGMGAVWWHHEGSPVIGPILACGLLGAIAGTAAGIAVASEVKP